jgi:hypothetical protein
MAIRSHLIKVLVAVAAVVGSAAVPVSSLHAETDADARPMVCHGSSGFYVTGLPFSGTERFLAGTCNNNGAYSFRFEANSTCCVAMRYNYAGGGIYISPPSAGNGVWVQGGFTNTGKNAPMYETDQYGGTAYSGPWSNYGF